MQANAQTGIPAHTTHVQQPAFTEEAGPGSFFDNEGKSSFFSGMPVQAKLSISPPDDPQEREADAVADTAKGSFFQWKQQFCGIPIRFE